MKRVNIGLSEKMHMQAKVLAVLKGVSLNEYFSKAIQNAIEKDKKLFSKIGSKKKDE